MASQFSAYWANKILNAMCRQTNITAPTNIYLALFSDSGGVTELSGNGYARKEVTSSFGSVAASSSIANTVAIQMATASGAWAATVHVALYDASSSGNKLCGKDISLAALTASGQFHYFDVGALTFTA